MNVLQPSINWANLPDHILVSVLSQLPLTCRYNAALVCSAWSQCFESNQLWSTFSVAFLVPENSRLTEAAKKYGQFMKHVTIELDQAVLECRSSVCQVIKYFAQLKSQRIKYFKVKFIGENPYFYAGIEFVDVLMQFFGPRSDGCTMVNHLTEIDLGSMTVAFDDKLLNTLSENNKHLEKLNIQNRLLVCKVSSTSILCLVQRCRKLRELAIFNYSLSDDILLAFTEPDRTPLKKLSLKCRREEKYIKETNNLLWRALSKQLPDFRVCLIFDYTCPFNKIATAMKPDIPVSELHLETFTYIYDEVRQASTLYKDTLEKLVLQTPMSRNSPELSASLILLASDCKKLKELHIYCPVGQDVVDKILELCPQLRENKTYTFK